MDAKGEVCVGCAKKAPKTETNYTLISPKYGWRLSREKLPNGTYRVEWRCPDCWREKKVSGQMPAVTVPLASPKKR